MLKKILTIPILVPMHRSIGGFRKSCQGTTQNPKRCKLGGIVGGDEGPIGGVAQVDCYGVKVGVGVHGEEGQEEDGEVREEVKGEVEENQGRRHMDEMRMEWQTLNGLEPCGV